MNDSALISVTNASKVYRIPESSSGFFAVARNFFHRRTREQVAVQPLSFTVNRGDMLGLVGPNGAGKSSLIKMLTGILRPDSGEIKVLGLDPFHDRQRCCRQMGVVFGQRSNLWWDLPASETFQLIRTLYGISRSEYASTLSELNKVFSLSELMKQPVRTLSLGQRVRCSLAAALLPRPPLLFLDEPTIGLDALTVVQLIQMLQEVNRSRQTTIILTSHDLAVIEQLCGRIMLFDQGAVVFDGTVAAAVARYAGYKKLRVVFRPGNTKLIAEWEKDEQCQAGSVTADGWECIVREGLVAEQQLVAKVRSICEQGKADYYIEKPTLQEVLINAFR